MSDLRLKAAIIGPGNIGSDLLMKLVRSPCVEPVLMVGIDPDSDGLKLARSQGVKTLSRGLDGLKESIQELDVRIVFDATSAKAHKRNYEILQALDVFVVDLTPAAIGKLCIPTVNMTAEFVSQQKNINMVTCGGQATIPIVHAVSRVQSLDYAEIVATISSRSAGPGTRQNIDEFTVTTAEAIREIGGAPVSKAIIILNPAKPPLIMRDTIHCITRDAPAQQAICDSVARMVEEMQQFVPGYQLKNGPVFDGNRVSVFLEVKGNGDYLPVYAGNLDIMTSAAIRAAQTWAQSRVANGD